MAILLYRVDERLIHGQVLVSWGAKFQPQRIIVVDDQLATSTWEQELYALGLPEDLEVTFTNVADARVRLPQWRADPRRSLLLVRDLETMGGLARGGVLSGERVNIGGIHYAAGRERVLPYVFLSAADRRMLEQIAAENVEVVAQDLPGSKAVALADLLQP